MFESKDQETIKIKDKIYKKLKDKFPTIRFGIKYIPKSEKQEWDWVIVSVLTKGVKESTLREIDDLCFELQRMRKNKPTNKKGLADYIESEYEIKPINQLNFLE